MESPHWFCYRNPPPKKINLWYLQSFVSWACIDVTSLGDDKYLFVSNVIFFEQIEPTITNQETEIIQIFTTFFLKNLHFIFAFLKLSRNIFCLADYTFNLLRSQSKRLLEIAITKLRFLQGLKQSITSYSIARVMVSFSVPHQHPPDAS